MDKITFSCKTCGYDATIATENPTQEARLPCVVCGRKRIFTLKKTQAAASGLADISSTYRMVSKVPLGNDHTDLIENDLLTENTSLYKYTKAEYAEKIIDDGIFRIGTLHEYQNIEKHGSEIGDHEEGVKYIRNAPGEIYDYSVPGSVPRFVRNFIRADEGQNIKIVGIPMVQEIISPNFYLYSVTSEVCINSMKEFGYDAVIEIQDPASFFHALTVSMKSQIGITEDASISPCDYRIRASHYSSKDRTHPAIIKDYKYLYQKEIRAIWSPASKDIDPQIIHCPEASRFCKTLKI